MNGSSSSSPRSSTFFTNKVSSSRPTIGVYEISAEKQERLERLRLEFDEIDADHDQNLTFAEVREFLARKAGEDFDELLCQELFASIDKDRDSLVTVDEFIMSYVQAAELIQTRTEQLERQVTDNQQHLDEAQRKLEEASKGEKYNGNGVMVGSVLTCHVREAKNLKPTNMRSKSDPYVILTCERQRIETKYLPGETNPVWDEVFTFQIEKKEANLRVTVMDRATIGTDELQGQVVIPLSSVEDQLKHDNYYELRGKDGTEGRLGKIRLGLQWIWSKVKYFETIVGQWKENLEMDRQELENLHSQLTKLDRPFGFLVEAQTLRNFSDSSNRGSQHLEHNLNMKFEGILGKSLGNTVDWEWISQIGMSGFVALSSICMIQRPSFIDVLPTQVLLSCVFFYVLTTHSRHPQAYRALLFGLLLSLLFDLLWFLTTTSVSHKSRLGLRKATQARVCEVCV